MAVYPLLGRGCLLKVANGDVSLSGAVQEFLLRHKVNVSGLVDKETAGQLYKPQRNRTSR
jgi:hypothetical protein